MGDRLDVASIMLGDSAVTGGLMELRGEVCVDRVDHGVDIDGVRCGDLRDRSSLLECVAKLTRGNADRGAGNGELVAGVTA